MWVIDVFLVYKFETKMFGADWKGAYETSSNYNYFMGIFYRSCNSILFMVQK